MSKKVFSFDAETNGLWGEGFAIGALVYDENGAEIARFVGRLPDPVDANIWVKENVLPTLSGVAVTHENYEDLLRDFAKFYLAHKDGADVIAHMGYIVEAKVLRDMFEFGFIGEWDGPYPLYDVAGNLQAVGENPTSVDSFVAKHKLDIGEFEGGTHNPLYDSAVAAAVYRYILFGGQVSPKSSIEEELKEFGSSLIASVDEPAVYSFRVNGNSITVDTQDGEYELTVSELKYTPE